MFSSHTGHIKCTQEHAKRIIIIFTVKTHVINTFCYLQDTVSKSSTRGVEQQCVFVETRCIFNIDNNYKTYYYISDYHF